MEGKIRSVKLQNKFIPAKDIKVNKDMYLKSEDKRKYKITI